MIRESDIFILYFIQRFFWENLFFFVGLVNDLFFQFERRGMGILGNTWGYDWNTIRNSGKASYSNKSSCFLILKEGDTCGILLASNQEFREDFLLK